MVNEGNSLSVVAIVVALVALVTTVGQVLQQYLATADGYRRCQSSVIGHWSKRTRLKWRWSEFRFETRFTTPYIALYRHPWVSSAMPEPPLKGRHWIIGSVNGDTMIDNRGSGSGDEDESSDLVTWLRFLRATQWAHKKMLSRLRAGTGAQDEKLKTESREKENQFLTIPLVTYEERSWDFMPPDVVKPYARISVGDIAIIARRLGMDWERFEPAEGILRAQGNGYMLTSTSVRSVGTMIQISEMLGVGKQGPWMPWVSPIIPDMEIKGKIPLIPSAAADKMGFGVLPAVGSDFLHRDFKFSTVDDIKETLRWFTRDPATSRAFDGNYLNRMGWYPGVSDLLAIAAPLMYRPDLGLVGVPSPTSLPIFQGVTSHEEGFKEFSHQVLELTLSPNLAKNSPLLWVRETEQSLTKMNTEWINGIDPIDRQYFLLSAAHNAYLQTTSFLSPTNQPGGKSPFFRFLVSNHLRYLIRHFEDAYTKLETDIFTPQQADPPIQAQTSSLASRTLAGHHPLKLGMATYFACLPGLLDQMEREIASGGMPGLRVPEGCWSREELMAGWVVLVFRAMLWNRCHYLVQGQTVPVQYCGSQLPIYIG
jgi:hypothetical protein